jgi:hypothetical protein
MPGCLVHRAFRLPGHAEIGLHMMRFADAGRGTSGAGHDARAFVEEQPRGGKADAVGRAGDETGTVAKPEIHGSLAYPA